MLILLLAATALTAPQTSPQSRPEPQPQTAPQPPADDEPQPEDVAIDPTPGRCAAAADRLDTAVRLARDMLDAKNVPAGGTSMTQARIARAEGVSAAIHRRFPKASATDEDRDDISGGDIMPFAELCLSAKPDKAK